MEVYLSSGDGLIIDKMYGCDNEYHAVSSDQRMPGEDDGSIPIGISDLGPCDGTCVDGMADLAAKGLASGGFLHEHSKLELVAG